MPDFDRALRQALGDVGEAILRAALADGPEVAFVGGWVRDALLGRPSGDVDLATDHVPALLEALKRAGCRKQICLDPVRQTWRVVLVGTRFVDVCALKGGELEEDLRARDLTVNAIAWVPEQGLVDPLGGIGDLQRGVLRLASPGALGDDPLRALRVARFATRFSWRPDPELVEAMGTAAIERVSLERIQTELAATLLEPAADQGMRLLGGCGLLRVLPPSDPDRLTRALARRWDTPTLLRLHRQTARERGGELALRLGWLLRPGVDPVELTARRWPTRVAHRAAWVANVPSAPAEGDAERARRLVGWAATTAFRLAGLAVDEGEDEVAAYLRLLDEARAHDPRGQPVPRLPKALIPPRSIQKRLGAGPQVGEALDALLARQLDGTITTRAEAWAWLRGLRPQNSQ